MNHMSTTQLVALMGAALHELESRFMLSEEVLPLNIRSAFPAIEKQQQAPAAAPAPAVANLSLIHDPVNKQFFYSVCGYPSRCTCRYPILEKLRNAKRDAKQRPEMDDRALYLYGATPTDSSKLHDLLAAGGCEAVHIKVVRNYAFLTFATHALAAAAQQVLSKHGYSVVFNRIDPERRQRRQKERRRDDKDKEDEQDEEEEGSRSDE
jgi:hypothetical protein